MRKTRLEKEQVKQLIEHFVVGVTARTSAKICRVNFKTAVAWYNKFRKLIAEALEKEHKIFEGEIELDESYFGGKRKGKRGRGANGKVAVFGIYKRNGYVHTVSVCKTRSYTLIPLVHKHVQPDSIVYTDCYRSYDVLDASQFHHYRINHDKKFVENKNHINGIENFWRQAKRNMQKYNGIPRKNFDLFLKECEWRFNYRPTERLLKMLYTLVMEAGLATF